MSEQTATKEKLVWIDIDMTEDAKMAEAFALSKELYAPYKAAKDAAEERAVELYTAKYGLPATHTLKFGYRFGPPSFAIVEAKAKGKGKGKVSVADAMAAMGFKPEAPRLIKKAG